MKQAVSSPDAMAAMASWISSLQTFGSNGRLALSWWAWRAVGLAVRR